MRPATDSARTGTRNGFAIPSRTSRSTLLAAAILLFLASRPAAWTQEFWLPPPPISGMTPKPSLRTAIKTTQTQASLLRAGAHSWGVRAGSTSYRAEYFQQDFPNMQFRFGTFRDQFNIMASLAVNSGQSRARNAVAELDAGLNIIAELFTFLESQFNAGALDAQTVVRTCQAFEAAMKEWETELRRNISRLSSG